MRKHFAEALNIRLAPRQPWFLRGTVTDKWVVTLGTGEKIHISAPN